MTEQRATAAQRALEPGERFACLFSGGKDGGLALHMASLVGPCAMLLHCIEENAQRSVFHQQPLEMAIAQAKAMRLPLWPLSCSAWHEPRQYVECLKVLTTQGIRRLVTGDMHRMDVYDLQRGYCQQAGIELCMPLWGMSWQEAIALQERYKLRSVISSVDYRRITSPERLLGKPFGKETCDLMLQMGLDPFGENGEFHTILVDGALFSAPVSLHSDTYVKDSIYQHVRYSFISKVDAD